jgi:hypothetical protein
MHKDLLNKESINKVACFYYNLLRSKMVWFIVYSSFNELPGKVTISAGYLEL